ncbi:MAG: type II toxin-antitoxin system VapC family toxin [Thermoguttaceae bacterium]|jgi:predicted nucleic acid-binding protein|nr:type II toxin-antitoxin system VapC family toxin [Thermoguttaceae bacterium]
MKGAIVDSCVLLDVLTEDPQWFGWSSGALAAAADRGLLVINPVIYAEVSIGFERIEDLEAALPEAFVVMHPISREAAFLAGKAFLQYRRRGGSRTTPLPDFLIGAHAAVANLPLVTRDAARFRSYFPSIELIEPSRSGHQS